MFLGSRWTVSSAADRVGLRLSGSAGSLAVAAAGELPSEGMATGSVQVPPSGNPILFLNDHPVTGGYPVIAVVGADALGVAAQLAPGDQIVFELAGATDAARACEVASA
jgi:allophanate hydrolase subunit 2